MADERRSLAKRIELAATPEQVWQAVSTPDGLSLWFVPHENAGGEIEGDFGGGNSQAGQTLELEPGRRVVFGAPGPDGVPPMTFEFLVEGRAGTTELRLIQNGFFGDDWETEFDGFGRGWDMFLHNLAEYFRHFPGLPVTNVVATAFTARPGGEVWTDLTTRLGADPALSLDDQVRLTPDGLDPIEGVVDLRGDRLLGIRTENGFYRFMSDDIHHMVNTSQYFYGVTVDRATRTAAWQTWIDGLAGV
ncbi:SRPBCC domain-containing protein [Actinokineospora auranticolor]|uniref:Uncharacterized protein YndB with AHSA1/START domain n=1 Tax=Actinokineospora auranticolor TaxID=155976 RepID=A0A2S6H1K6_9PSEU|nr:SRPBCC domain-containing protein [Actinokineospora auranticolor]PPK71353.1 uncharacterized protein YndB with AHSA1/START domain [Actinokineospora auranticolor]